MTGAVELLQRVGNIVVNVTRGMHHNRMLRLPVVDRACAAVYVPALRRNRVLDQIDKQLTVVGLAILPAGPARPGAKSGSCSAASRGNSDAGEHHGLRLIGVRRDGFNSRSFLG